MIVQLCNCEIVQLCNCTINFACGRIDLVTRVRLAAGAVTLTAGGGAFAAFARGVGAGQ